MLVAEKKLNRKYQDEMTKMFGPVGPNYAKEDRVEALKARFEDLAQHGSEDFADKMLADELIKYHLG